MNVDFWTFGWLQIDYWTWNGCTPLGNSEKVRFWCFATSGANFEHWILIGRAILPWKNIHHTLLETERQRHNILWWSPNVDNLYYYRIVMGHCLNWSLFIVFGALCLDSYHWISYCLYCTLVLHIYCYLCISTCTLLVPWWCCAWCIGTEHVYTEGTKEVLQADQPDDHEWCVDDIYWVVMTSTHTLLG